MNPAAPSNAPVPPPPPAAFSVDDIFFTVFRHKTIILLCACLGIAAAVAAFKLTPVIYSSKAKLIIRYITEETTPNSTSSPEMRRIDASEGVLNTEVEILTSLDVAKQVATNIGPARILAMKGGGDNPLAAAGTVKGGVTVIVGRRSEVIVVFFEHPDREIVQPVLSKLLEAYLVQHLQMHIQNDPIDADEEAHLRTELLNAEKQLEAKMRGVRVVDIDAMKKVYNLQLEKLNTDLMTAETELAERQSVIQQMAPTALASVETNALTSKESPVPPEKLDDYSLILGRLSDLNKREREFRMQGFTDAHPSIASLRNQRDELMKNKAELEKNYPSLVTSTSSIVGTSAAGGMDIQAEVAKMLVLKARARALGEAISNITTSAFNLAAAEPKIAELRRDRDEIRKKLEYLSARRETQRSGALSAEKLTNIKVAEYPTPPIVNNQKRMKITGVMFAVFFGAGLLFAFAYDFVIDRTIRRGADVKRKLKLPVLLTIEHTSWGRSNGKAISGGGNGVIGHHIAPWDEAHHLHMVNEGLRERLVTHFEINDVTHKPKLVALTACDVGSGVTTLAAGLAAALSKTGEGSVLLVDMQSGQGVVKTFYKGKPGGAEPDSINKDEDEEADEESSDLMLTPKIKPGPNLPNSLTQLVPGTASKNYDFIIFDMPTITPTSVTPRLASHMDLVLLVLESGKTSQQTATRAAGLLSEARANTVAILNKCRRYVPERLSQEL